MTSKPQANLATTLGDLSLHHFQITPDTLGQVIAEEFDQKPNLPGVIVAKGSQIIGVISRRRFHERISKAYGQELFLRRPIHVFLEMMEDDTGFLHLLMSDRIEDAMRLALQRPSTDWYEPIVVVPTGENQPKPQVYFLLDFHTLLLAQSQILTATNQKMQQQTKKLEQERQKVRDYAALLEQQQATIQERNQQLERQKTDLVKQSQEISKLNRKFFQIGQLLSLEGKRAFHATFEGVNAICQSTDQIARNGHLLREELETVRDTSALIEKVSNQVRHLAIQAAIVANHIGAEMVGFSHVTDEIGKLGSQIIGAGRQMDAIASRFEARLHELMGSAQAGTDVARSMVEQVQKAQEALIQLEHLVQVEEQIILSGPPALGEPEYCPEEAESEDLASKLAVLEDTLSELKNLVKKQNSGSLVKKLQTFLEQANSTDTSTPFSQRN
jgi:hypothetical protein